MAPVPASGLSSTSYPPSSTTAATILYSMERNLTFASEWYFKPEGVKLVKQRFEVELRKRRITASHRWNEEDQTFRVRCLSGDVHLVWPIFYNLIVDIIKSESREDINDVESEAEWSEDYQEDRPIQSDLIERLEMWRKENRIKETSVQELPTQNAELPTTTVTAPSEIFPELVKYYKSRTIWSVDPGLDLDLIASDEDLKELVGLTGCQFVKVLNERKIYIGGHSEENCRVAIYKLDNLRKYHRAEPYMDHLFYSEDEENYQLVLKPFVDIKKGYFETTLLEHFRMHSDCNYQTLPSAITVRIAPYNHSLCHHISIKNLHIVPAVKPEDKDCAVTGWMQFKYIGKGEPTEHHRFLAMATQADDSILNHNTPALLQSAPVQPISTRQNKEAHIQRWANDVPAMTTRPLGHLMQELVGFGGDEASGSTNKKPGKSGWDTYKQFDDKPGTQKESTVRQHSVGLATSLSAMRSAISARAAPVSLSRAPQPFVPQESAQNQSLRPAASGGPTVPSQPSSGLAGALEPHSQEQMALENIKPASVALTSIENNIDSLDHFLYQQPQRSILDDDISVVDYTDPFMQPIKWEEHVTESQSTGHPGSERMQALSEAATRSFHNTMNQRASKSKSRSKPKPKPNPYAGRLPGPPPNPIKATPAILNKIQVIDPLPEFIKKLNDSFAAMMERARGFRGQVEVEAEFGRIILNNIQRKYITPRESTDRLFPTEKLQNMLLNAGSGFDTFFTSVLTTAPGEIPYLLNITKADGKELWENEKSVWTVKYELYFEDNATSQKRRFIIEIDAKTFVTQIKSWRLLGNIFIHGLGRHWDIRIAANGYESGRGLEEEYGRLATAIEVSLHIPTNLSTPVLFFELEKSISERFQLAGIRVHRISRYKSKNTKVTLKISEIQSLEIQKVVVPEKPLTVFKLSPGPSDQKPVEKLGRWYEASIICSQLDELLEENKELQLGEETKWTAKDLLGADIAQSLYLPACEMLKKMDGVGQHSHNGVNVRSGLSLTESQVSQKPKEQFW